MSRSRTRLLYVALALWIVLSLGYYIAGVTVLYEKWFNGAHHAALGFDVLFDWTLFGVDKTGQRAGLANGDALESFNRQPYTGDYQVTNFLAQAQPGDLLALEVRTKSGQHKHVEYRLGAIERNPFTFRTSVYLLLVSTVPLLALLVGYWVVAVRPSDPHAWLVLCLLTFWEVSFGDLQAMWWGGWLYVIFGLWGVLVDAPAIAGLVWFGLLFPERGRIDRRWPALKWIVLGEQVLHTAFYLWLIGCTSFGFEHSRAPLAIKPWVDVVNGWADFACIALFLVAIFDKVHTASTPDARRRLRVLATGSALSLGPVLIIFGVLPYFGLNPHNGPLFELAVPFLDIFPLTLAYVLIVHRAMDVRVLLRMGTKYALAQASVYVLEVFIAGLVVWLAVIPLIEATRHRALDRALAGALIVFLIWAFTTSGGLGHRLQIWLDRKFFREAYEAEQVLSDLSEYVRKLPERNTLVETVARRISETLHVSQVAIWLRASASLRLEYALGLSAVEMSTPPEVSVMLDNLARLDRVLSGSRNRTDQRRGKSEEEGARGTLQQSDAELVLPLPGRNRLLGVMTLGAKRSEEPYTPTDLRVLQSVATQTGLALEVNELAESLAEEAARRARVDRELEIAHEVQERLFPQTLPAVRNISLAGHCRPAQGVGGDYYDAFELRDGRLALAIGDVSGKGISAALLMASLRAFLRTLTYVERIELGTLMAKINYLVYESSAVNRYATFFFAVIDPVARSIDYSNAGHNPPLLLRNGGERIRLEEGGPPIGLLPRAVYGEGYLALEPGDLLLAYTDGISEAQTRSDEEWGEDRFFAVAEERHALAAPDILQAIFAAADQFTASAPQHDDMTLLIAKL